MLPFNSKQWDSIYAARQWGRYPNEHVVRFVARRFYRAVDRSAVKFLDLGCGSGAQSCYLAGEGFDVTGIDGSAVAIDLLRRSGFKGRLDVDDISHLPYADEQFDCVIDAACLVCNPREAAERIVADVKRILKPGGIFFSITSSDRWRVNTSMRDGTEGSRISSLRDIDDLYGCIGEVSTELAEYTERGDVVSHWLVTAIKRT